MGKKSFTLGGVYLGDYGLYIDTAQFRFPVMPRPRDRTVEVPGKDGKIYLGSDLGEREFPMPCILTTPSVGDFWGVVDDIVRIFAKGLQELVFDIKPDRYLMAKYNGVVSIEQIIRKGKFELPMIAYDPYFYDLVQSTVEKTVTTSPYTFDITRDLTAENVAPVIRIKNTGATVVTGLTITRTVLK